MAIFRSRYKDLYIQQMYSYDKLNSEFIDLQIDRSNQLVEQSQKLVELRRQVLDLEAKLFDLTDNRDRQQRRVAHWVKSRFGLKALTSKKERIDRLLEEVCELAQSEDHPIERVIEMANNVYAREKGEPYQELGGVAVTLLGYAASASFSLLEAEATEITRIHDKPIDEFRARQREKAALGMSMTCQYDGETA